MSFALRHRSDAMPSLTELPGLSVKRERRVEIMAAFQDRTNAEMHQRFDLGHRAYVATVGGLPAAWGWVATRTASIGEVKATFTIPEGERYLWNFVTMPSYRGLGIYPRLLQAILRAEEREAERFWIGYAPENHASASGIRKAGFTPVADLSFDASGAPALKDLAPGGAALTSRLLGIPETTSELTPCWRCVRAGRSPMGCAPDSCTCDYQKPVSGCAA